MLMYIVVQGGTGGPNKKRSQRRSSPRKKGDRIFNNFGPKYKGVLKKISEKRRKRDGATVPFLLIQLC